MYTQQLNATFQFFRASYSNRSKVAKQYNVLSSSPLSISRRENYWSESSVSPPPNTYKLSLNLWKRKIPRKMGREGGRERERGRSLDGKFYTSLASVPSRIDERATDKVGKGRSLSN